MEGSGRGERSVSDVAPTTGDDHLQIEFEALSDRRGIVVSDPIERSQFTLSSPAPVRLRRADPAAFQFPAAAAVSLRTDRLDLETAV